jgi:hypothetical protein
MCVLYVGLKFSLTVDYASSSPAKSTCCRLCSHTQLALTVDTLYAARHFGQPCTTANTQAGPVLHRAAPAAPSAWRSRTTHASASAPSRPCASASRSTATRRTRAAARTFAATSPRQISRPADARRSSWPKSQGRASPSLNVLNGSLPSRQVSLDSGHGNSPSLLGQTIELPPCSSCLSGRTSPGHKIDVPHGIESGVDTEAVPENRSCTQTRPYEGLYWTQIQYNQFRLRSRVNFDLTVHDCALSCMVAYHRVRSCTIVHYRT